MNPRPRLRRDLVLVEQTYRGEQSFIIKDPESRKYFRFRPVEIKVMQALDGERTCAEAAALLAESGLRVSAGAVESFAGKLTSMGLCERTLGERSVLLMERLRAERRRRLGGGFIKGDLLRIRWSVGDPDKLFDRWMPRLEFFFSRTFIGISVVLFALYCLVVAAKWPDFARAVADLYTFRLDAQTLVVFWLTATIIVVIHELGHGFTCKHFGGQVHEIGAMLIYFEPAFFCNVNDAWTFPERSARLWVTAAGSWIQLVVASIAAIVWWAVEPGTLLSQSALAAVLIGGVTTVFMNANPLIPLDGYYALSDYLEVPNLRHRALGHLGWLVKTRLLRLDLPQPPADQREQRIFLIYAGLAAGYIILILGFFAFNAFGWLTRVLGFLGLVVFAVGVWIVLRQQLRGWGHTLAVALRARRAAWRLGRWRTRLVLAGLVLVVLGCLIPWPITISGPFTVAPGAAFPHLAPDSGFVDQVQVREGIRVPAGTPLLRIRNLELDRQAAASRRVSDSLAARSAQARARGLLGSMAQIDAARAVEAAKLSGLQERVALLNVRALGTGVVMTPRPQELKGQWVSRGQVVMQLGEPDSIEVRIDLDGPGSTRAEPGQPVRLLGLATMGGLLRARLTGVAATATRDGGLEARVRLPAQADWRPGMTGYARITLRRSNFWGALWWTVRRGVRSDILL